MEVLKRIGIEARKVNHLVVTHVHFVHVSGIRLFPKADIYIQEKEFRFWFKDPIAKRAPFLHVSDLGANRYLKKLEGSKRLHRIPGDKKILPGIELVLAPGHTPGMQAVVVNTAKGKAVVGSDVAHFFVSYRNDIPSTIITRRALPGQGGAGRVGPTEGDRRVIRIPLALQVSAAAHRGG